MRNSPSPLSWSQVQAADVDTMVAALSARAKALAGSIGSFDMRLDGSEAIARPQADGSVNRPAPTPQGGPVGPGDYSGFNDNVPRSLIGTESGGNWAAHNNEEGAGGMKGHFGLLQFGHARFNEAKAAGAVPAYMTIQQFGQKTPEARAAQVAATNWHFNDIDQYIRANGLDRMLGQSVAGVPLSMNGMRAIAHLGGSGGLSKFIRTGGAYNPSDSFGTSLADYGRTHF